MTTVPVQNTTPQQPEVHFPPFVQKEEAKELLRWLDRIADVEAREQEMTEEQQTRVRNMLVERLNRTYENMNKHRTKFASCLGKIGEIKKEED